MGDSATPLKEAEPSSSSSMPQHFQAANLCPGECIAFSQATRLCRVAIDKNTRSVLKR